MVEMVVPALLAVLAGSSIVVQQVFNANLRAGLGSAMWAGVVSYLVGLATMTTFTLVLREPLPSLGVGGRLPWFAWTGGVFGAIFIGLAIVLLPRLGAATFIALLVTGQMMSSMAFDWLGCFGLAPRPPDFSRSAGAGLLILGVLLVRR